VCIISYVHSDASSVGKGIADDLPTVYVSGDNASLNVVQAVADNVSSSRRRA